MGALPRLLRAPGRGQYDRRQSRESRLLEQRARLLAATALSLLHDAVPSVGTVVKLAGVSRNTFYEYFDDLEHARTAAALRGHQRLEQRLRAAEQETRTPVERWRALVHAWTDWSLGAPAEARLCLEDSRTGLSAAGRALEAGFARSAVTLRTSGVAGAPSDPLRVTAVAAAGEALVRQFIADASRGAEAAEEARARQRIERSLLDIAVRLLR